MKAGFGFGMDEKIAEAYNFIANNYGPGDEIFIFGFSRGMVDKFGMLFTP